MNLLLDYIMNKLLSGGYVKPDDAEVVRYGLELTVMKTLISAAMLITALVLDSFFTVIVFLVLYSPMRSFCGGYHSKTRLSCFISSMLILAAVISAARLVPETAMRPLSVCLTITGTALIVSLAPTDTPTKPFEAEERAVFRKRSLLLTALTLTAAAFFSLTKLYKLMTGAAAAVFFTGILLAAGRISNRKERQND